jgi:predicted Fe-Mo cluster-binding NifX family protein
MDGEKISAHFGRSKYFVILEVEDGTVSGKEIRENPHAKEHHHSAQEKGSHHHGHSWVEDMLGDCDIVVTKGLGEGALRNLQALGKRVIITESSDIEEVLKSIE